MASTPEVIMQEKLAKPPWRAVTSTSQISWSQWEHRGSSFIVGSKLPRCPRAAVPRVLLTAVTSLLGGGNTSICTNSLSPLPNSQVASLSALRKSQLDCMMLHYVALVNFVSAVPE